VDVRGGPVSHRDRMTGATGEVKLASAEPEESK
jgi:hypothetical protein